MSFMSWLAGAAVLVIQTVALLTAARGARQRLMPRWSSTSGAGPTALRPVAVLATAVLFVTLQVLVGQLVGLVGLFHWAPLVLVSLAAAALLRPDPLVPAMVTGVAKPQVGSLLGPTDAWGRARRAAVTTGTVVVTGHWVTHLVGVYRYGSSDGDSMMYHLPFATRFVQSGRVADVPLVGPDPWVAFYPANVEVVQATVMAPFDHVAVVPLISLGWLFLGLLAGWCIGARAGHGPLGLLAAAAVFSVPVLAATHAGTGRVDVAAAAFLLAAVALLVAEPRGADGESRGADEPRDIAEPPGVGVVAVAGLALGLAIGAKFVILPTAGLLLITVGAVLWWRAGFRTTGVWVGAAAGPCALWLIRNWMVSGSPVPMVDLRVGPVGFAPLDDERLDRLGSSSVVDQLQSHDGYWGDVVLPAFRMVFGLWPVTLAFLVAGVAAAGLVLARLRPVGLPHAVATAALAGSVIFFFSPNSAPTPFGPTHVAPTIVALNTRYLMPSLLILLCLLAAGLDRRWRRTGAVLCVAAAAAVIGLTSLRQITSEWPVGWSDVSVATLVLAGLVAAAAVGALLVRRGLVRRPVVLTVAGVVGVAALTGGTWLAAEHQVLNRYHATPPEQAEVWYAVHDEPGDRSVAVLGEWLQQPLYRDDLANEVQYLGNPAGQGIHHLPEDCPSLAAALADGAYDLVVVQRGVFAHRELGEQEQWLAGAPGVEVVTETGMGTVVRLPDGFALSCAT